MKHVWPALLALSFLAACSPPPAAESAAESVAPPALSAVTLPSTVEYPEGVAFDPAAQVFYTVGAADGAVVRVGLDGTSSVVTPAGVLVPAGNATFPGPLGLKIDNGRLFIAGGRTGKMWIVEAASGKVLKTYTTPASTPGGLINDVAIADGYAYFTDTFRPTLWRASSGATPGALEPWLDLKGGPIAYGDGANLNGIAATPDGKTLFVVQMNKGLLFKIDIATKQITPIDLKGQTAEGADGVILNGDTVYIVRQPAGEIVTVKLNAEHTAGDVTGRFSDPALLWPATAVIVDDRLYVVNTQFNAREAGAAVKPFTIAGVPLAALDPK